MGGCQTERKEINMKYYATITVTYVGEFEADSIEEVRMDPDRYARNVSMYGEIEDYEEWGSDGDEDWEE